MEKYYSKTHEWVAIDGDEATAGITAYAAKELGDITYVETPKEDTDVILGDVIGTIESVKAAADFICPVSGIVYEVNHVLDDDPGVINQSAERKGWICKINNIDLDELEELMDEEEYKEYVDSL